MAANGMKQCLSVLLLDSRVYCPLGTMGHSETQAVGLGLGLGPALALLKENQKSELRVSRQYIEVETEIALDLVSRRSV